MDEIIIDFVRKHPMIWNTNHPEYKNVDKKNALYEDLGRLVGKEAKVVRSKWHGLRSSFNREHNKQKKYSSTSFSAKKPWRYYDALMFLKDSYDSRDSPLATMRVDDRVLNFNEMNFELDELGFMPDSSKLKPHDIKRKNGADNFLLAFATPLKQMPEVDQNHMVACVAKIFAEYEHPRSGNPLMAFASNLKRIPAVDQYRIMGEIAQRFAVYEATKGN